MDKDLLKDWKSSTVRFAEQHIIHRALADWEKDRESLVGTITKGKLEREKILKDNEKLFLHVKDLKSECKHLALENHKKHVKVTELEDQNRKNFQARVGVGVFIVKDSKILLGKRKGSHDAGTWSPPGGHLEFHETPDITAIRETAEECGVRIKNIRSLTFTNDIYELEQKHYITIFLVADYASGEPKILEPDKCDGWEWYDPKELPRELSTPMINLLGTGRWPSIVSDYLTG